MHKLKELRLDANLRLIDLASLSGLSVSEIWNLENGLAGRATEITKNKVVLGLHAAGLQVTEKDIFK